MIFQLPFQSVAFINSFMSKEKNVFLKNTTCNLFRAFLPLWLAIVITLIAIPAKAQISLISNGNFELANNGAWTANTLTGPLAAGITNGAYPNSGTYYAYVGNSTNSIGSLFQVMYVPTGAGIATITFYLNVGSAETTTTSKFDVMDVNLRTYSPDTLIAKLATYSNLDKAANGTYTQRQLTYDLSAYRSQYVLLQFYATNDFSNITIFRIDNVSVQIAVFPTVQTISAGSVTATSATLTGSVNPNGVNTTAYFEYGLTTAYGNVSSFTSCGSGTTSGNVVTTISGLSPNTVYHYRIDAYNNLNTSTGSDATFTNLSQAPTAPSGLIASSAPNGISLSWQDNSSNENGFYIQRRQGSTYNYFSVGANQTSFLDTSASQSVQYCYSISATNSSDSSLFTSEQCAIYNATGPPPVAIIAGNKTPVTGTSQYIGSYSTGSGLHFSWSTSNGQVSTNANPQFQFNSPGSYSIYLTITDSAQRTSPASIQVNVQASNSGTTTFIVAIGADPVVLATGNYIQNRIDLQMPGKGFSFEFKRFYNSKFSDQTGLPLGFGWTFNYNERLVNTGTNVLVIQGDGSTWTFYPTNSGYVGEPGIFNSLGKNPDNTWVLTNKSQTVTLFDTNGYLLSITDKNNNTLTFSYSGGILSQIIDTAGRAIVFSTNTLGCISAITDPIGRSIQFVYDAPTTNLIAVVDANGQTNRYFYDDNHQMTSACDPKGTFYIYNEYDQTNFVVVRQHDAFTNWTYFGYDFTNRITYFTNALGKVSTHFFDSNLLETNAVDENGNQQVFLYDTNRNRTYVKDKNGNETRYGYDSLGNVTNKTDALVNVTTIQYDALNNPIRRVDALTNTATFGYDSRGNLTSTTNALGLVSRVQYDPANGLPIVLTDARGHSASNQFDAHGNLTNAIDAHGFTTQFVYDGVGRKIRQIDALHHISSFNYDKNDNLIFTTNEVNFVNAFVYDRNNNRISSTNPRGATVTNIFDLKDRLIAVLAPLNQTNGTLYDALDRKVATFDALGNPTYYGYDNVGNLIAVTNALNQATRFTYDSQGNQTSVIDPTGHYVTNFFDALNRKVATIDASIATNSIAYDALGRVSATTNAISQVTQFFYDAIGRLTNVVDAANKSVFFVYDQNSNRVLTTDPNGHSWTNCFDELNRLAEQDDPDANRAFFHYDPVGNLTNKFTPNCDKIVYSYDALNRLTNIAYPNGPPVTFAYDEVGNRTNMTDSLGATTWQFDLLNRLTSVTDPYGQTVANGYDPNGNRVSLTYPGNKVVNYGFDALNRMITLTNWLNGVVIYTYDSRGNSIAATNANGTTASYAYDVADRLVALTNAASDASVIAAYAITLDAVGNHTQATHNQPLFPILPNQTNNYAYNSDNRLVTIDGQTVTHNANGDLTRSGTNSYAYDFEDRLVQLSLTNTFTYDSLGNRLARTVNEQTRRFVLDRMGALTQVLVENDANNSPVAYYVYGLGLAHRISSSGTFAAYHFNIQGSTVALTDSSGKVTDSYAYDSFGVMGNSDGASPQPFRYLGQYGIVDDSTGLLYARARYFSPQLGRFLSKDPITGNDSDCQSLNRYIYALNRPISFHDASGLSAHEFSFSSFRIANSTPAFVFVSRPATVHIQGNNANSTLAVCTDCGGLSAIDAISIGLIIVDIIDTPISPGPDFSVIAVGLETGQITSTAVREANYVYRGLAKGEDVANGLTARLPSAGNTPIGHVAGKRATQWISTSKSETTALEKYGANGVVRIDLNKVTNPIVDVSDGFLGKPGGFSNWAIKDQEVLIQNSVPPGAITVIK